ncbi:MAG: CdaR family protein [Defluviitaleaceae bacterium]|nr:CdaR family protein [Defluviitaleaceae bacterium]
MDKNNIIPKLKDLFVTNLPLKIGAVLIAVAIWFLILNFNDPVRTQELSRPLQLRNETALMLGENQFFLENADLLRGLEVTVQVRGNNADVSALEASLEAYIDLSTSDIIYTAADTDRLPVRVNVTGNFGEGVDFRSHNPSSVILHLDNIIDREFPVELSVTGQVAEGYVRIEGDAHVRPDAITLRGPSNALAQIDRLELVFDVEGESNSAIVLNQRPEMVDTYGDVFQNANINPLSGVTVTIPIHRGGMAHVLPVTHEGDIGAGFGIQPIHVTPSQFEVAGSREAIQALTPITLPPIALNGATQSFTMEFDIRQHLPTGVFLVNSDENTATVQVVIEPIGQRTFTVTSENVNFIGATNFQVMTESVSFTVSALESILEGIDTVNTSISMFGRGEGEHTINMTISLPPGATVVGGIPSMTVRIGAEQGEDEDYYYQPTAQPEPEPDEDEDDEPDEDEDGEEDEPEEQDEDVTEDEE